jgi:anti-sigma regulatory factor (Ser/Thr protein kinase)
MVRTADWSHGTLLAADPVSASKAREFVRMHLEAHGLQHLVDDVRLVASELATNALAHARTSFTLTLSWDHGTVLIDIRDGSSSLPETLTPGEMDANGRGLMLVESLSHAWGTSTNTSGLKSVWASFREGQRGSGNTAQGAC